MPRQHYAQGAYMTLMTNVEEQREMLEKMNFSEEQVKNMVGDWFSTEAHKLLNRFDEMLQDDPFYEVLDAKGYLLTVLGRYEDAIVCFQQAMDYETPDPGDQALLHPWLLTHIGNAYLKWDRLDDAVRSYEEAMKRCPDEGRFEYRRAQRLKEEALALLTSASPASACPSCAKEVDQSWLLCPWCATQLKPKNCPSCSAEIQSEWIACPFCGTKL